MINRKKRWSAWASLVLLVSTTSILRAQEHAPSSPPDIVLTGDVTGAQNKTYFEVPFKVPSGTHRISVDFQYTGKEERATLDLGIAAPPPVSEAKSEATTATQPIPEVKSETKAAALPVSKPALEVKSEVRTEAKPAVRREAAKSAKKGSR